MFPLGSVFLNNRVCVQCSQQNNVPIVENLIEARFLITRGYSQEIRVPIEGYYSNGVSLAERSLNNGGTVFAHEGVFQAVGNSLCMW